MSRFAEAWNRWFFDPVSTSTLGVVRIAYGLLLTVWTLTLAPDVLTFYARDGLLPDAPDSRWRWSILEWVGTDAAVVALWAVLLLAAVALTAGAGSRVAAVVAVVALTSFHRRDPWVLNSGDLVVRNIGVLLALAPSGAALSVDRWLAVRRRPDRSFWDHPTRAPWALRLVQITVAAGYLFAAWGKVRGTTWNDGTAVGFALRIDDLVRFAPPDLVTESVAIVNLLTFGTLAVELAVALLVWNRTLRPWVLGAGVLLHLGIDLTIQVGFFSYIVLVSYLAFVPPEVMDRVVSSVRRTAGRDEARTAVPAAR